MNETFAEKISRLEMMADLQDTKWDLSDRDRIAIRALLDHYRNCEASLKKFLLYFQVPHETTL